MIVHSLAYMGARFNGQILLDILMFI